MEITTVTIGDYIYCIYKRYSAILLSYNPDSIPTLHWLCNNYEGENPPKPPYLLATITDYNSDHPLKGDHVRLNSYSHPIPISNPVIISLPLDQAITQCKTLAERTLATLPPEHPDYIFSRTLFLHKTLIENRPTIFVDPSNPLNPSSAHSDDPSHDNPA